MTKQLLAILMGITIACGANAESAESRIRPMLKAVTTGLEIIRITESSVPSIMKVELSNGKYVYVTKDARYLFYGELHQYKNNKMVNLTERDLARSREKKLESIASEDIITFQADDNSGSEIFVFTDVSCGYCKKLHRHIEDINNAGITVHYLAFPRAGEDSPAGRLMSNVWCSKDRKKALTEAKQNGTLKNTPKTCTDPIAQQRELGLRFGMTGTPGIYDSKGRHLGGYLTTEQLSDLMN